MRALAFWITTAVFVGTASARAGDRIDELRESLAHLKTHYPAYLENTFRAQAMNYFSWRLADFFAVGQGIAEQSDSALSAIHQAQTEAGNLRVRLALGELGPEEGALEWAILAGGLAKNLRTLEVLAGDSRALVNLWADRCSEAALAYPYSFFVPSNLYAVNRLELKAPESVVTIGFEVSSDYGGGVGSPSFFGGEDAMVITTATAIGAHFGGIGAPIAGGAAFVAVSVKNAVRHVLASGEEGRLTYDIQEFQRLQIDSLQLRSRELLRSMCQAILSDQGQEKSGARVHERLARGASLLEARLKEARELAQDFRATQSLLEAQIRENLTTTSLRASRRIQASFLRDVMAVDDVVERSDQAIRAARPELLSRIKNRRLKTSESARVSEDEGIWDWMVENEARSAPKVSFGTSLWSQVSKLVAKELGQ